MSTRELSSTGGTPLGLRVLGRPLASLEVRAMPGITRMTAELHGPQKILDQVRAALAADIWTITWPDEGAGGSGGVMIQSGGGVFISSSGRSRSYYSGSGHSTVTFGGVSAGGRIVIDGVDMTDVVNQRKADQGIEPCRAVIMVPEGTEATLSTESGNVATRGRLAAVDATTVSGDITTGAQIGRLTARSRSGDIRAEDVTGPVMASTVSGDIRLSRVYAAASLNSVSGDISAHVLASVNVAANSVSGDIRVTAAPGVSPLVGASSVSGRVRTY